MKRLFIFILLVLIVGFSTNVKAGWDEMESGTAYALRSVWGSSGSDVFAVGYNGTILHYDGTSWSDMESGIANSLWGIWGSSGNDVFAVGHYGTILHYDGTSWSDMESGTANSLWGIWGSSGSDVFVADTSASIPHYDGTNWSAMRNPETADWGFDVWGSSGSDVIVAGAQMIDWDIIHGAITEGIIYHYDGSTWAEMNRGGPDLWGIWGSSGSDVFAVGLVGTILHYDGSSWFPMESGTNEWFYGIWGSSPNDVFIVGNAGTILHYDGDYDSDGIIDGLDECTDTDGDGYGNPGFSNNTCPLDNCPDDANPNQEDDDLDGIGDACDNCPNDPDNDIDEDSVCGDIDNCPNTPNGSDLGTCVETIGNIVKGTGATCTSYGGCELDEYCDLNQGDHNDNGIGDACECYADIDGDGNVYPSDLMIFIDEYGRTDCCINPPCLADIDGDCNVYPGDIMVMIAEFGKTDCPVNTTTTTTVCKLTGENCTTSYECCDGCCCPGESGQCGFPFYCQCVPSFICDLSGQQCMPW